MLDIAITLKDMVIAHGKYDKRSFVRLLELVDDNNADPARQVLMLALFHGLWDLQRTASAAGFGEEHITSSLFGHLVSHLYWYYDEAVDIYGDESFHMPELHWAYQDKPQEAVSGIDFGVVRVVEGNGSNQTGHLLIQFFQAKNATRLRDDVTINVSHVTHAKSKPDIPVDWSANGLTLLRAAVGQLENRRSNDQAIRSALLGFNHKRFQLETLLHTHFRGQTIARSEAQWCFYSIWRPDRVAQAMDLIRVVASLQDERGFVHPSTVSVDGRARELHELLTDSLLGTSEHTALRIELSDVEEVVEHLAEVHQGINLLIAAPGPLDHELKRTLLKTHKLSPPLFSPANYVPRPRRAVDVNEEKDDNAMGGP